MLPTARLTAIMPSAVAQGALAVQIRMPFDDRSAVVRCRIGANLLKILAEPPQARLAGLS